LSDAQDNNHISFALLESWFFYRMKIRIHVNSAEFPGRIFFVLLVFSMDKDLPSVSAPMCCQHIKDKRMERKRIGTKRKREYAPEENLLECLINRDQVGSALDFLDLVKSYKLDQIGEDPEKYDKREAFTKGFDQEVKTIFRNALLGDKDSFEYLLKLLQDLEIPVRRLRRENPLLQLV
jgi:hypothetical protein